MNTLKKQSINFLLVAMLSILFIPFGIITTNAVNNNSIVQPNNEVKPIERELTEEEQISGDNQVPNVSFNQAKDLVERKTYDVVSLLQTFVKPFASLIFIASAIMALFGAITRSGYVGKGLIGMFIAGVMYTAVLYAPEIMNFFSTWIAS